MFSTNTHTHIYKQYKYVRPTIFYQSPQQQQIMHTPRWCHLSNYVYLHCFIYKKHTYDNVNTLYIDNDILRYFNSND
jgi:hypothetical protein